MSRNNLIICPIHMKGNVMMCDNYRAVTLLYAIYKILANILYAIYRWKTYATRLKGRPRVRWEDGVRNDLRKRGVTNWRQRTQERKQWEEIIEQEKKKKKSCRAERRRRRKKIFYM
jgi:hypothetical protein